MSVLMPCLNESKYLRGCLESLLLNDYQGTIRDNGYRRRKYGWDAGDHSQILCERSQGQDARKSAAHCPTALNLAIPAGLGRGDCPSRCSCTISDELHLALRDGVA